MGSVGFMLKLSVSAKHRGLLQPSVTRLLSTVWSVDYCNDQERKIRKAELFAKGLNSLL